MLRLEAEDVDSFLLSCSLEHFRRRFALERGSRSNPFEGAEELREGSYAWQRRLLIPEKGQRVALLCCPEDVKKGKRCQHSDGDTCGLCEIPLCWECHSTMLKRSGCRVIPMGICNDNFGAT